MRLNSCFNPCLVSLFNLSLSPLIFQIMFAMITNFSATVADASLGIGGVMVKTIVKMDPTRKIAVVSILFIFH